MTSVLPFHLRRLPFSSSVSPPLLPAMAASSALSFSMATPVARAGSPTSSPRRLALLPSVHRMTRVRSQAEEAPQEQQPTTSPVTPATPPTPPPKAKASTKFSDALAFSGPAPERINGRLAMVGFVSAVAVELARGDGLFSQLANGGLAWFAGTATVLSLASLVPLFKGVQSRSSGVMTADAELWNGRFAMLGVIALAFTEYLKGGPLV